jgi:4a-hydroxytetrahydrobiopterin dehydratase
MGNRDKLTDDAIAAFVLSHPGWTCEGASGAQSDAMSAAGLQAFQALVKTFSFKDYASGIAFVVRLAFAAEKRDHHPDLAVHWGKVRVTWSTHDAGGVTGVDTEMAEVADRLYTGA